MSTEASRRGRVSFRTVFLFSTITLGIIVGAFLGTQAPQQRTAITDVMGPVVDALAAVSLFLAARSSAARSKRATAWAAIGLAMLLYAIGDISWTVLELLLKESPFPSVADGFYLAYYPFFMAGVILLSNSPASPREQLSRTLDVATILAAAILGFWNFLLGPILKSNAAAPLLEQSILLAYPVGDLVLLGALLLLIYGDSDEQDTAWFYLLAAGMAITIVTDALYSYQSLLGTYFSGSLLDLGWIVGYPLIGLAGASQWTTLQRPSRPGPARMGNAVQRRLKSMNTYFPYVWLLAAFVLLIVRGLQPLPMSFLSMALSVGVIMTLVLVRQLNTLAENRRLNAEFQSQAARLQNANQDLNAEIAERQRIEVKLSHDALHDGLTGLPNRVLFLDRLERAIERSKRHPGQSLAVLFMDVDHFKVVNDSLGHSSGDQLLVLIGERLTETVRTIDTVARFGGDEFTVLLEELRDADAARVLTDRIQTAMRPPFMLNEHVVHISMSIGIATDLVKYEHPEDMLRDADLALYQAKTLGKARSEVFETDMREQAFSRLQMEEELRTGLERGQFQLYYQPILSLKSDRIVSLEALLRWNHPSRGLVLPAQFLPVAEESGLIIALGDWALREACRQLKVWHDRHRHLKDVTVSVNISNTEFSQPNLAQKVAAALRESGLKGAALRLEITERVMVGSQPTATRMIAELEKLGVELQIDDFGIGYSALAYLRKYPIHAIKIDGSFIHQMRGDHRNLGLVRAMVAMARELGMDAIAEGIETGEQLQELKGLSCGFGQGYGLSEPLDPASAEKLLAGPKRPQHV
jgi:diguanylate cyclase (GGDEF)-like protein